jgi:hypothetical protein
VKATKILAISGVACIAAVLAYIVYRQLAQETVWVVKDQYDGQLHCDIAKSATVGEWVILDATLSSDAWIRVPKATLNDGQLSSPTKPREFTEHVAPHLQWQTEPPTAEIKQPSSADFDLKFRQIRFPEPGDYRIRAISHWPYKTTTNWMSITIAPSPTEPSGEPEPPPTRDLKP